MRSHHLASSSLFFVAVLASAGCAQNEAAQEADYGLVFDSDGRADSSGALSNVNPADILDEGLRRCIATYPSQDITAARAQSRNDCYRAQVNAAAWSIDWRNERRLSNFARGSFAIEGLRKQREQWRALCEKAQAAITQEQHMDQEQAALSFAFCESAGELSLANAMVDFAFHDRDGVFGDFSVPALSNPDFECAKTANAQLAARAFAVPTLTQYAACTDDYLVEQTEWLVDELNFWGRAAQADAGNPSPSFQTDVTTTLDALEQNATTLCVHLVVAGEYTLPIDRDQQAAMRAVCDAHFALSTLHPFASFASDDDV